MKLAIKIPDKDYDKMCNSRTMMIARKLICG